MVGSIFCYIFAGILVGNIMKRRILLGVAIIVVIVMAALAMTKPDRVSHYEAVKTMALKAVDHELSNNPETAEYAALGTVTALNMIDEYLKRNLLVYEHTFYNSGVLIYNDNFIPISVGVFNHVYLTFDEEDMKRVIKMPEIIPKQTTKERISRIEPTNW